MADLQTIYNNLFSGESAGLKARLLAAVLQSAAYILAEDPATANHANRYAWAKSVLVNETVLIAARDKLWLGFIQNATIQALGSAAEDNDINYTVATLMDTDYAAGPAA